MHAYLNETKSMSDEIEWNCHCCRTRKGSKWVQLKPQRDREHVKLPNGVEKNLTFMTALTEAVIDNSLSNEINKNI